MEPAVPGALGAKPAPPAVAITTAAQSALVFSVSIQTGDFVRRPFVRGNSKLPTRPLAHIDELAALAAKRAVGIAGILGLFVARWALHGNTSPSKRKMC